MSIVRGTSLFEQEDYTLTDSLAIVIPTYNEEKRLAATLRSIIAYTEHQHYNTQILVVDDGSRDKTQQVFLELAQEFPQARLKFVKNTANHGKGYVVRQGMLQASGDYIFFTDADLSTPIPEIEKLLKALKSGADVAIGSRAVDRSLVKKHQPWFREFAGRLFNFAVRVWAVRGIKDTQCGFKGFTAAAAKKIFTKQRLDSFIFDVEVLYIARKSKLKVVEIPVEWVNNEDTRFAPNLSNFLLMWKELFRVRFLK